MNLLFVNFFKTIQYNLKNIRTNCTCSEKPPWSALFFGTDEFSLYSLKSLHKEYKAGRIINRLEIVTTTNGKANAVRKFAEKHELCIHSWPLTIPTDIFHVGLVVSFGHLIPETIINQFHFGMLNVHASLLPKWRGAAPIIYAIANGDKETGVTIMRIRPKHFDIGEILMQEKISILYDMKMPELHEKLGNLGAKCLVETLQDLPVKLKNAQPQQNEGVTFAPKITSEFGVVHWNDMSSSQIYNRYRALTGLIPLTTSWNGISVKLLDLTVSVTPDLVNNSDTIYKPGLVKYDKTNKTLKVLCVDRTWISVTKIGVFGKKVMSATDFNNGYLKKELLVKRYFR